MQRFHWTHGITVKNFRVIAPLTLSGVDVNFVLESDTYFFISFIFLIKHRIAAISICFSYALLNSFDIFVFRFLYVVIFLFLYRIFDFVKDDHLVYLVSK